MGAIRLIGNLFDMAGVETAVQKAQATADNARQMVLTRDPRLTAVETNTATLATQQASLESLAATLGAAIPASDATHATMRQERLDGDNALSARITALEAKQPAFGFQATTSLALLATKDYTVTLNRAMPSATYTAKVHVDPAVAGKLSATVLSQTATTVTVRTSALVAVGVGGFTVIAWP